MLAVITIAPIQTNSIDMIISRGSRVPLTIKNIPINIPKNDAIFPIIILFAFV